MVGNVGVGSVTAVVLWLSGIRDGVPLWFGTVLALVALRTWHARGMTERIARADAAGLRRLRLEITGLMSATALTWGLMPWLSYHGESPLLDFFSITMLVGMTAGAVQSVAAVPLALRSYIVLGFSPFVVKSVFIGGTVYLAGGLLIIFTMLIWLSYARSAFRIVHRTLTATRENEALAEALRQERDAVRNAMQATGPVPGRCQPRPAPARPRHRALPARAAQPAPGRALARGRGPRGQPHRDGLPHHEHPARSFA